MLTRRALAAKIRRAGLEATVRTVRYWTDKGLLPRPFKIEGKGNKLFYPSEAIERGRLLASLRPKRLKDLKRKLPEEFKFGGKTFRVVDELSSWHSDGFKHELKLLANGQLLLIVKKEVENGLGRVQEERGQEALLREAGLS